VSRVAHGCGNICDGDFDQDGVVNGNDFLFVRGGFYNAASCVTDHNGDGITNGSDFLILRGQFLARVPGPSLNVFRNVAACP